MGEGKGVFNVVSADFNAAKFCKIGAGAEFLADVFSESTNISAGTAVDFDFEFGVGVV